MILERFTAYTGLDVSSYQLGLIPEKLRSHPKVTLTEYDLNQPLPFKDESFDLAISISVIEYLFDPIAFVKEANRILTPGGTFILHTMNLAFLPRRLQLVFGKLPTFNALPGWQGGTLHEFTFPTLRRLLENSGFGIRKSACAGLVPSLRMWWPNLLASDMIFRCTKARPA
jgi:SAM-dependent methyltransferase